LSGKSRLKCLKFPFLYNVWNWVESVSNTVESVSNWVESKLGSQLPSSSNCFEKWTDFLLDSTHFLLNFEHFSEEISDCLSDTVYSISHILSETFEGRPSTRFHTFKRGNFNRIKRDFHLKLTRSKLTSYSISHILSKTFWGRPSTRFHTF